MFALGQSTAMRKGVKWRWGQGNWRKILCLNLREKQIFNITWCTLMSNIHHVAIVDFGICRMEAAWFEHHDSIEQMQRHSINRHDRSQGPSVKKPIQLHPIYPHLSKSETSKEWRHTVNVVHCAFHLPPSLTEFRVVIATIFLGQMQFSLFCNL